MSALLLLVVADDNTSYLLRRYAEKCGLRTERVSQPELVICTAQRLAPVAIILETGSAWTWAHKLLAHLKRDTSTNRIPIVVCASLAYNVDTYAEHVDAALHYPLLFEDFLLSMEAIGVLPMT